MRVWKCHRETEGCAGLRGRWGGGVWGLVDLAERIDREV